MSETTPKAVPEEKIPHSKEIIVATNLLYKKYRVLSPGTNRDLADTDGIRGDLALNALNKTLSRGVRIVAADGGSSEGFLHALESLKARGLTLINSPAEGLAPQRRIAFEKASVLDGGKVIIYTQPEKDLTDVLEVMAQPILDGTAQIVLPRRNPELFQETWPEYMRDSEIRVNKTYNRLLRRNGLLQEDLDWFFGPVAISNDTEIVSLFLKIYRLKEPIRSRIDAEPDPEKHSGSHYFPIIEALWLGKVVQSVEIPYRYPSIQRGNEMSDKAKARFMQRRAEDASAYPLELIHFIEYLKGNPESKIVGVNNT